MVDIFPIFYLKIDFFITIINCKDICSAIIFLWINYEIRHFCSVLSAVRILFEWSENNTTENYTILNFIWSESL